MMSRRLYAGLAVAALAVATVCVAVESVSAQYGRSGFNGRYSSWNGWNGGFGDPYAGYSSWNGWGTGYGNRALGGWYGPQDYYSSGWSNYPAYSNYGWGTPQYSGWGNEYTWSNPSYYGEGMGYYEPSNSGAGYGYGQAGYGTMSSMGGSMMSNHVLITVRVPANAQIWFDGEKTNQMGSMRTFISPALNPDRDFVYHIRAQWTENGQTVDKTRRIDVHAGDRLFVNFFNASPGMGGPSAGQPGMSGQYGTEPGTAGENRTFENRNQTPQEENTERTLENRTAPGNQTTTTPSGTTTTPPAGTNTHPKTPAPQTQPKPPQ
jgi:uncharacterized protein (TIGR03000 family)